MQCCAMVQAIFVIIALGLFPTPYCQNGMI